MAVRPLLLMALTVGFLPMLGCGSETPTDPNPDGPLTAGMWIDGGKVCLFISEDRRTIERNVACDGALDDLGASFIMILEVGEIPGGGTCSFSFRYTDPITINNSKFSVENWTPEPDGPTYSFEGTFNKDGFGGGDVLLGSATGVNVPFAGTCTGTFRADPV